MTGTGSEVTSSALLNGAGEGETTTVSTFSEDEGAGLRCSSDSKKDEISEDRSSPDDCSGVGLGEEGRSEVVSGGVAGSVELANCRLTLRGK